jgi:hypothetical protein
MSWSDKDNSLLLKRSFLFGITGIILSLIPIVNAYFQFVQAPMVPLQGVGLLLQMFGLSIAVMVLRKRKNPEEIQDKAKKMIVVLAVALVFFVLTI